MSTPRTSADNMAPRHERAVQIRDDAARMHNKGAGAHADNGDREKHDYAVSFTKGLKHDRTTGLANEEEANEFYDALKNGFIGDLEAIQVPQPLSERKRRRWEAPTAGFVFSLEGPDAQSVSMEKAPVLGSKDLTFEMAELYAMAALRDQGLPELQAEGNESEVREVLDTLNDFLRVNGGLPRGNRKSYNSLEGAKKLTRQTLFRGSSPGCDKGPYLSNFLIVGRAPLGRTPSADHITAGKIPYGAQLVDQHVAVAQEGVDFMTSKEDWLDVQEGFAPTEPVPYTGERRPIHTLRDLATYVHVDALYQAYLNATFILLNDAENHANLFDPGFQMLANGTNITGFALFGGPHILTLVTEVATRALKAVRFQKFQTHLRGRPELIGGRLALRGELSGELKDVLDVMASQLKDIATRAHKNTGNVDEDVFYLPMAFPEGSPMHPSYGAGHAAVAGACVTILKAFFNTAAVLVQHNTTKAVAFRVNPNKDEYTPVHVTTVKGTEDSVKVTITTVTKALTLGDELNKLAANISIARNMAGVHFYSDYWDSLRLGEKIALGILKEQANLYQKDEFIVNVPKFDGGTVTVGRTSVC